MSFDDSGVDEYDDQLATLMEDFICATQLQISLKKRIDIVMKQRESAVRAQEEKARMQWEETQEKRQKLVEANRLLRLKMEQTESTGYSAREKDTEEDAGGNEPFGRYENLELKAEHTEPASTPLINEVVSNLFTAVNAGIVDGNLQNAKPTNQIPIALLHYSPKRNSALIATPKTPAMSKLVFSSTRPSQKGKVTKKKDPIAPKKALSPYMFFTQEWREKIKEENPGIGFGTFISTVYPSQHSYSSR